MPTNNNNDEAKTDNDANADSLKTEYEEAYASSETDSDMEFNLADDSSGRATRKGKKDKDDDDSDEDDKDEDSDEDDEDDDSDESGSNPFKQFETLLVKNKNINKHPKLAEMLSEYTAGVAAGYLVSEDLLAHIVLLDPTDPEAQTNFQTLLDQLHISGYINEAPVISGPAVLDPVLEDAPAYLITQTALLVNATDADDPILTAVDLELLTGSGVLVDNGDGTWSYTPAPNDDSEVSFGFGVSDNIAAPVPATATLDILAVNDAPVLANPISNQSSAEDTLWSFQVPADTFSDIDDSALALSAVLADGSALPAWLNFDASTATFSGQPPQDFNGALSLRVTGSDGALEASSIFDLQVTPVNDAPVLAAAIADQDSPEDEHWSFQVPAGTFSDVDNASLTISATLGNGTPLPGWLDFDTASNTFSGQPPLDFNGTLSLEVTASDGEFEVSSAFDLNITAVNDAPTLVAPITDQDSPEDSPWSFRIPAGTFADVENDALTLSASLSDGSALPAWLSFDAASGAFSGQAPQDFNGIVGLKVTASDGELTASSTFDLTITPVNDAPVVAAAIADQANPEDTFWSYQVPADTFSDVDNASLTLTATLSDGSPLPAWISFDAGTRKFSGLPPVDFNGVVGLKVTASDGELTASSTFDLTITPVNDAPVAAAAIADQASPEDTFWSYQVPAGTFSDVDNASLTLTATLSDGSPLPAWINFDAGTRKFSGLPPADFNGVIGLKVTASDGELEASSTFDISVTPVNDAPVVAAAIADRENPEDTFWSYQVPAGTFTDVDDALLTLSATLADGSALPAWLSFNANDRKFSGQPPQNFHGVLSLKVTASDGELETDSNFELTITPVNDAPVVVAGVADQESPEDEPWSFQVPLGTFADVDNASLTLSASLADGSPLPAWLSFDPDERKFSGQPPQDFNGKLDLKLSASDGEFDVATGFSVSITAVNDAPTTDPVELESISQNSAGRLITQEELLARAADVDGDELTAVDLKIDNGAGALTDNSDGTWTFVPAIGDTSDVKLEYEVSDGNLKVAGTATLDIEPLLSGTGQDGYYSGSTVYGDTNDNLQLDSGESRGLTDAGGNFILSSPRGDLVLEGGTDIATGINFIGQLRAPEGYQMITPVTTLVSALMDTGKSLTDSEDLVRAAFDISASVDLASFDPIAETAAGNSDGNTSFTAGSLILNTVSLVSSLLIGAGSSAASSYATVFAVLANQINNNPGERLEFGDSAFVVNIIKDADPDIDVGVNSETAAMVAILNQAAQTEAASAGGGTALLSAVSAVSQVAQGAASTSLTEVGKGTKDIADVAPTYAGTNLETAIDEAAGNLGDVNGPAINGEPLAKADSRTLTENQTVTLNVLANDSDPENDTLTVSNPGTSTSALGATVSLGADGTLSYDPSPSSTLQAMDDGQSMVDTISYTISDSKGGTDTGTATFTVTGISDTGVPNTLVGSVPAGTELQYFMRTTHSDGKAGKWVAISGFESGMLNPVLSSGSSKGLLPGNAEFADLTVDLGANSETLKLVDSLVSGKTIQKVEIEAYASGVKDELRLIDDYQFGTVLLSQADSTWHGGDSPADTLSMTFRTYNHSHLLYDTKTGKSDGSNQVGWDLTLNKSISTGTALPDYISAPVNDIANDAGTLQYFIKFEGSSKWLELSSFGISVHNDGTFGSLKNSAETTFNGAEIRFGTSPDSVNLTEHLTRGTLLGDVEIEAYRFDGSAAPVLIEQYQLGTVYVGQLETYGPEIEQSATLEFGDFSRSHATLDKTGKVGSVTDAGWSVTDNKSHSPTSFNGDFNFSDLQLSSTPGSELEYYMRVQSKSGGKAENWIKLTEFSLGLQQEGTFSAKGGFTGVAAFDALTVSMGTSAESIALLDSMVSGSTIHNVEIEAYRPGGSAGKLLVDEYQFETVVVANGEMNGQDSSRAEETMTLKFAELNHGHVTYDDKGKMQDTVQHGWSTILNKEIAAPVPVASFVSDSSTQLATTAPELDYFLSFDGGSSWLDVESVSMAASNSNDPASFGGASNTTFSGVEISFGSEVDTVTLTETLVTGSLYGTVEIEAYAQGAKAGPESLVEEIQLGTVLLEQLTTSGSGGATELAATLQFADFSRSLSLLNEHGVPLPVAGTGWDVVKNTSHSAPTPSPSFNGKGLQADTNGSDELYVMRVKYADSGSGKWLELSAFDIGIENTISSKSGGGGSAGSPSFGDLSVSAGTSTETVKLLSSLLSGDQIESVEVEVYEASDMGSSGYPYRLINEYLFQTVVVTEAETYGRSTNEPEDTFTLKFGKFQHAQNTYDSKVGTAPITEAYAWDIIKNTAAIPDFTSPDYLSSNISDRAFEAGSLNYYLRLDKGSGWIELEDLSFTVSNNSALDFSAGKFFTSGKTQFDGLEFTMGSNDDTPLFAEYLTEGKTFADVEIEAYVSSGFGGAPQIFEEYQFGGVLVESLFTAGTGTEVAGTLQFADFTRAVVNIGNKGTVSGYEDAGWDQTSNIELIGQAPEADLF